METKEIIDLAPIEQFVETLDVKSVFGEPVTEDGVTLIPVAEVQYGFGYGGGYGSASGTGDVAEGEESSEEADEAPVDGAGGGGGAGGRAAPRGFIRITPDEVTFEPITNEDRIPLAGILMVAWSVFWTAWTIRTLIKSVARVKEAKGKV
jgi:uncharacterized spore protein YtfJ